MRGRTFLTDHFLVAMPTLQDPNFARTVTYICEHNAEGAMGIVINRPLELHLDEVLRHMDIELGDLGYLRADIVFGQMLDKSNQYLQYIPQVPPAR